MNLWHTGINVQKCRASPMPAHVYVEENGLTEILTAIRSAGVTPEVNLREHVKHTPLPSADNAAHSGFIEHHRCLNQQCPMFFY